MRTAPSLRSTLPWILFLLLGITTPSWTDDAAPASRYFRIRAIDATTGRGIPLVELETVNSILFVSDSAGLVAIDEPGLMGQSVFFHVRTHGYEFAKDGFG